MWMISYIGNNKNVKMYPKINNPLISVDEQVRDYSNLKSNSSRVQTKQIKDYTNINSNLNAENKALISIPTTYLHTKNPVHKSCNLSLIETCHIFMSKSEMPIHALIT